jgi:hypothetical protein
MKSQISAQVFIYIAAALLVALILLFGAKAISLIVNLFNKTDVDSLQAEITREVTDISKQTGSVKNIKFTLSGQFEKICFVDSMNEQDKFTVDTGKIDNAFIRISVSDNARRNVFILKNSKIEKSFYVQDLNVQKDYLCLDNKGLLSIWLQGNGKTALLYTE